MVAIMTPMRIMEVRILGFYKKILMTHKMRVSTPLINNDTVRKKYYFTFFQFNKLQLFTSIYFCFAGQTQQPLWGSSPHFSNVNWDYADQEMDVPGLDIPGSWKIGCEV